MIGGIQRKVLGCFSLILCVQGLFSACVTQSEGERMEADLFRAQKRLFDLEQRFEKTGEESKTQGYAANRMLASSEVKLDQIDREMRRMAGELDTLRRGVVTGELPGYNEQSDSVAKTLRTLDQRLTDLENAQIEVLAILQDKKTKGDKARVPLKSLGEISAAFAKKRYTHVSEDAPKLLKTKAGKKDALEIQYWYAESLFKLGKLRDAALAFNDLEAAKASLDGTKKAQIGLRLGDCFRLLGDQKAATIYYQEVIQNYPSSDAAQDAKTQLAKLPAGH